MNKQDESSALFRLKDAYRRAKGRERRRYSERVLDSFEARNNELAEFIDHLIVQYDYIQYGIEIVHIALAVFLQGLGSQPVVSPTTMSALKNDLLKTGKIVTTEGEEYLTSPEFEEMYLDFRQFIYRLGGCKTSFSEDMFFLTGMIATAVSRQRHNSNLEEQIMVLFSGAKAGK